MVERKESQGLSEFDGIVESITLEDGLENKQFHLVIEPTSLKVSGKTGKLHEWVPMSGTSSDDAIAKGSVIDFYLRQLEIVLPAAKKASTVTQALGLMKGKKFHFQKMELGRAFAGHPAKQYAVPVKQL